MSKIVRNINFKSFKNLAALWANKRKLDEDFEKKIVGREDYKSEAELQNDKAMKELKSFHLNLVLPLSSKKPRDILICFFKSTHFTLILLILGSVDL